MPGRKEEQHPSTDTSAFLETERVVESGPVTNTPVVTGPPSVPSPPPRPSVQTLYVYDSSSHGPGYPLAVQSAYYRTATIVAITSWDDLTRQLAQYGEVGELVIYAHGNDGAFMIGGRVPSHTQIQGYFQASRVHVIDAIRFECCSVMRNPVAAAEMIQGIAGPHAVASGYTLYLSITEVPFMVTDDTTIDHIDAILDQYRGFWMPNTPPAANILAVPGEHRLYTESFQNHPGAVPLPAAGPAPLATLRGPEFIPRTRMREVTVGTRQEAQRRILRGAQHIPDLARVTVTNIAAVAAPATQP